MKKAKQYFDNHTQAQQLFFTSDNLAFFDEHNAINHAKQLNDKTVITLARDKVYEELEQLTAENWEQQMEDMLEDMDEISQ